ncbi:hypothetical protein ACU4GD_23755 [Cupriavidus basilensis]
MPRALLGLASALRTGYLPGQGRRDLQRRQGADAIRACITTGSRCPDLTRGRRAGIQQRASCHFQLEFNGIKHLRQGHPAPSLLRAVGVADMAKALIKGRGEPAPVRARGYAADVQTTITLADQQRVSVVVPANVDEGLRQDPPDQYRRQQRLRRHALRDEMEDPELAVLGHTKNDRPPSRSLTADLELLHSYYLNQAA